jgi:L-asparaginase/Glu-tRNA(Gln) amidotransferase subunit D
VRVIRASRVASGFVSTLNADTPEHQVGGSGWLNPPKARIALMLELATGADALMAHLAS